MNRFDFVLLFDVKDGNPNGDPDAGNLPRVDPETGQGLVTDVCVKRKIRNYVTLKSSISPEEMPPGCKIYIQELAILNVLHREAYREAKIVVQDAVAEPIPSELRAMALDITWPNGFELHEGPGDDDVKLEYSGELDKDELKGALEQIESKDLKKFAAELAKKAKGKKPSREDVEKVRAQMCASYFDIRTFGAVMGTKVNAGQVRGPVQLTFGRSIDPILPLEHSITRMAVTNENDASKERTMGRKATVPYGLYRMHGFVSPALARKLDGAKGTGFSDADLALLWEALENMFEHDRSAARGQMATRALIVFEHDSELGTAPAHWLFSKVEVKRNDPTAAVRDWQGERINYRLNCFDS